MATDLRSVESSSFVLSMCNAELEEHPLGDWRRLFWGRGRIDRRRYWTVLISAAALGWLSHAMGMVLARTTPASLIYATFVVLAVNIASAWVTVCICAKRLHDVGQSGWWQAGPIGIAAAGIALAEPAWAQALGVSDPTATAAMVAGELVYLAFIILLGLIPGGRDSGSDALHA